MQFSKLLMIFARRVSFFFNPKELVGEVKWHRGGRRSDGGVVVAADWDRAREVILENMVRVVGFLLLGR